MEFPLKPANSPLKKTQTGRLGPRRRLGLASEEDSEEDRTHQDKAPEKPSANGADDVHHQRQGSKRKHDKE